MKKKYSIKANEDIQVILKKGKFFKCDSCIVYILNNNTDKNNVAFLAGKKLGCAPIRNKAKRKLRIALRKYWSGINKGFDIVIIARPFLIDKEQEKIQEDLENLLKKHKILKIMHQNDK